VSPCAQLVGIYNTFIESLNEIHIGPQRSAYSGRGHIVSPCAQLVGIYNTFIESLNEIHIELVEIALHSSKFKGAYSRDFA